MAKAIQSQGAVLYVSSGGSPTSFNAVGNITDFNLNGRAPDINVSNLDSTAEEVLPGIPKYTLSASLNFDPDNIQHQQIRNAMANRASLEWKIALTDATPTNITFTGYATSFAVGGRVNDKVAGSIEIAIDGAWNWA